MNGGLFITLYDDRTLALYLKYWIYGFFNKEFKELCLRYGTEEMYQKILEAFE